MEKVKGRRRVPNPPASIIALIASDLPPFV